MMILVLLLSLFTGAAHAQDAPAASVWLEDYTWPELENAMHHGTTTVIIPTGGTEQTGPHIMLGKHNAILRVTAAAIARRLGHTVVTPILPFVPEGNIEPSEGHMRFAGTLSLRPEIFSAVLEDLARSLKQHGFRLICFVGEHGASQEVQRLVAEKLTQEWAKDHVQVLQVSDYYSDKNGQEAWMHRARPQEVAIESHGGLADTSEMLAAHPSGVRLSQVRNFSASEEATLGVSGNAAHATKQDGNVFLKLKIEAAVRQIQAARQF